MQKKLQIIFKNYKLLTKKEHKELLKIRNLEYIRKASHNRKIISFAEHIKWIKTLDDKKLYYAVFYNDIITGGIHLLKKEQFEWGMFFDKTTPPFVSMMSVYSFINYMKDLGIEEVYALMKKSNKEAFKMNKFFNIKLIDFDNEHYQTYLALNKWQTPNFFKNKNISYKVFE